jgi:hypothetical protein
MIIETFESQDQLIGYGCNPRRSIAARTLSAVVLFFKSLQHCAAAAGMVVQSANCAIFIILK